MESTELDDRLKINLEVAMRKKGILTEIEKPNTVRSHKSKTGIQTPQANDTGHAIRGRGRLTEFIVDEVVECQWSAGGT